MTVIDSTQAKAVFAVIDAYDHPHGGRFLRLRLRRGEAPAIKELKSGTLVAGASGGPETLIRVHGFALFGGRVSDARLARTGRVDVHVRDEAARDVDTGWSLRLPA